MNILERQTQFDGPYENTKNNINLIIKFPIPASYTKVSELVSELMSEKVFIRQKKYTKTIKRKSLTMGV